MDCHLSDPRLLLVSIQMSTREKPVRNRRFKPTQKRLCARVRPRTGGFNGRKNEMRACFAALLCTAAVIAPEICTKTKLQVRSGITGLRAGRQKLDRPKLDCLLAKGFVRQTPNQPRALAASTLLLPLWAAQKPIPILIPIDTAAVISKLFYISMYSN